jgi:CrcB protein
MRDALGVGAGASLGAITRYCLGGWIARQMGAAFPYGTFAINVSGSFVGTNVIGAGLGAALLGLATGRGL